MKSCLEAANRAQIHGQEIEEQRAFILRGERDQLATGVRCDARVHVLEIRGLATESGPVVDDLAVDLTRRVVDDRHVVLVELAEEPVDVVFCASKQVRRTEVGGL